MRAVMAVAMVAFAAAMLANASYVNITEPYNATILQNGSIYLGKVGPGETFYVTISAGTKNQTGTYLPLGWDELVASSLPSGWISQNSPLYTSSPSIKIAVAPNAPNGTYRFNVTAINIGNYSRIGTIRFTSYVNVTPDVFKLSVSPSQVTAGPGQPSDIYVTINNTGVSDSPFNITVKGLPAWNRSSTVIALHHTVGRFVYPVYEDEPGRYGIQLYVSSIASQLIHNESNITLVTKATVTSDYRALGQGAIAFPVIYEPAYAVMYIIYFIAAHA